MTEGPKTPDPTPVVPPSPSAGDPVELASPRARYLDDRSELERRLRALREGDRLLYTDVARVIATKSWRAASKCRALASAIDAVETEDGVVLLRDQGIGVRLGTEADRLARNGRRAAHVDGIVAKGLEDLARADGAKLDADGITLRDARILQLGRIRQEAAPEGFRLILDAQSKPAPKAPLKLFTK